MKKLMEEHAMTQEALSERLGKSRPGDREHLAPFDPFGCCGRFGAGRKTFFRSCKNACSRSQRRAGNARARVLEKRLVCTRFFLKKKPPQTFFINFFYPAKEKEKKNAQTSAELKYLVERLRTAFKTKVSLIGTDKKGRIYIDYYTRDDLDRICELLDIIDRQE